MKKIKNDFKNWDYFAPPKWLANVFARLFLNETPKKYTDETKKHYTPEYVLAHYGQSINERIRLSGTTGLSEDRKKILAMVKSHHNKEEITLYRGVPDNIYNLMIENAKKKNCDLYEKAFLFCSLVKGQEINHKIKLRIKVPKGTNCIYLGNINDEQFFEVVVMTGAELQIIGKDKEYINCKLIKTE